MNTWTHFGDLEIGANSTTKDYSCMTHVVGNVQVTDVDQDNLVGFRNLVKIEGSLTIGGSDNFTDLSAFGCMEEVRDKIQIGVAKNLTDLSSFSALRYTRYFLLSGTGVKMLPPFAPDFSGLINVDITNNPSLTNLDNLSTWKPGDDGLSVRISSNHNLTTVDGIQALLLQSSAPPSLTLNDLPALESLSGLGGRSDFDSVVLHRLPLIGDLSALNEIKTVGLLAISGMPLVADLQGLGQLKMANVLVLGDCWQSDLGVGMEGLKSLEGMSSLASVDQLGIAGNPQLETLAGANSLGTITIRWALEDNPSLGWNSIDAFTAQVGKAPCDPVSDSMCACHDETDPVDTDTE